MTIQPQDITNKLVAHWKGPFTVTKVPNRFQVEYKENGVRKITHISYAKKFYGRHYWSEAERTAHARVSCLLTLNAMAPVRLSSGETKRQRHRNRRSVSCAADVRRLKEFLKGPDSCRSKGAHPPGPTEPR